MTFPCLFSVAGTPVALGDNQAAQVIDVKRYCGLDAPAVPLHAGRGVAEVGSGVLDDGAVPSLPRLCIANLTASA